MSESKEVAVVSANQSVSAFGSLQGFETAQRMAKALSESELVPTTYRGKLANCILALEVAQRCQASPLMVMQHLNMIHGRPAWSSQYIISAINSCGRFAPLKFKMEGEGDKRSCTAWTNDRNGEVLEGPPVTIAMAKAEGWYSRKDREGRETSKWQTMPELMLRYRAAAFFGRLYAPEILMGMRSDDEEREIIDVTPEVQVQEPAAGAASLNEKIKAGKRAKAAEAQPATVVETPVAAPAPHSEPVSGGDHF